MSAIIGLLVVLVMMAFGFYAISAAFIQDRRTIQCPKCKCNKVVIELGYYIKCKKCGHFFNKIN